MKKILNIILTIAIFCSFGTTAVQAHSIYWIDEITTRFGTVSLSA